MTDFSQFSVEVRGFAASSPLIDSWDLSDEPPGDGWFAVLLSYEEDGISPDAMQFRNGAPITFRAGNLVAHAGPFPDETTAQAWADAHNPYWTD